MRPAQLVPPRAAGVAAADPPRRAPGVIVAGRVDGVGMWRGVGAGREAAVGVVVVVARQRDLLEVVGALHPRGGLADLLHRGQQQADQDRDDGDDDEQFDQREGAVRGRPAAGGDGRESRRISERVAVSNNESRWQRSDEEPMNTLTALSEMRLGGLGHSDWQIGPTPGQRGIAASDSRQCRADRCVCRLNAR